MDADLDADLALLMPMTDDEHGRVRTSDGFLSWTCAALLACRDFNERSGTVVPGLSALGAGVQLRPRLYDPELTRAAFLLPPGPPSQELLLQMRWRRG